MATLIDTSLWVDFTRARSPEKLKRFIAPFILSPDAHLAEPIAFEILRFAGDDEHEKLLQQFRTVPFLKTPDELWSDATELGRSCRRVGTNVGSLDLLIASIAIRYDAELVSFDADYLAIAKVSPLRVRFLERPAA